jgi:hypothetical protein
MSKSKINTEYFKSIFNNVDVSIADHELIYNENGEAIDYKFLYANKAFCESINTSLENLIGKTVLDLFPETEKYWIDKYSEVVATGESLSMTRYSAQFDKQFSIYAFKSNENSFVTSFFDITNIIDRFKETNIIKPEYRVSQGIAKVAFFEVNRLTYSMDTSESFSYVVGLESVNDGFFSDMLVELTHHEDKKVIAAVINSGLNPGLALASIICLRLGFGIFILSSVKRNNKKSAISSDFCKSTSIFITAITAVY